MVLRSIGVLSCGKVLGITYALMGLLLGAIFALLSMAGIAIDQPRQGNAAVPFAAVGAGMIIILPIVYGVLGFIGGMIAAAVYNVVASLVGGLELEFERPATLFTAT
jgi:hypothetical protein